MKWRVVGWATYDDRIEEGEESWATNNVIVDEIKKQGYLFSGWAHQEGYCCAPVLNDGKIRRFTQRGWGSIMAEAHGYTGPMDYSKFAFSMGSEKEIRPQNSFDKANFKKEKNLNESFEVEVTDGVLADANNNGVVKLKDLPELRYLDKGDMLILRVGDEIKEFLVVDVDRDKDLTRDELIEYNMAMRDYNNRERMRKAEEEFAAIPIAIVIKLKKPTK